MMSNSNSVLITRRELDENVSTFQSTHDTSQISSSDNLNTRSSGSSDTFNAENCSNENNENENLSKTESDKTSDNEENSKINQNAEENRKENNMKHDLRIKLKYLNDEIKIVKGSLTETIGDFKNRNFSVELNEQKIIRLVFNGKVLHPDSKTLMACGLFNNCVVHCLIHKKPLNYNSGSSQQNNQNENRSNLNNNRNQPTMRNSGNASGPSLIYFGIIFSGLSIILGWYFRIAYSSIFSMYSTISLGIMTFIFLTLSPVIIFIERGVNL